MCRSISGRRVGAGAARLRRGQALGRRDHTDGLASRRSVERRHDELLRHRGDRLHRPPTARAAAGARRRRARADASAIRRPRSKALAERLGAADRIKPVVGRPERRRSSASTQRWIEEHAGAIDHVFHLAAVYDMEASDEANEIANVGGTRETVAVANALRAGRLHHVSSVAAAGDYVGTFTEDMFDEGPAAARTHTTGRSSSPSASPARTRRRPVAGVPARRSSSATRARARWTRSTGPTTSSRCIDDASRLPGALRLLAPRLGDDEHRPGRLRRRGDGPSRPRARARRPGVPPRQPRAAADGRRPQPLRRHRRRAEARRRPARARRSRSPLRLGVVRDTLLPQLGIPAAALDHASFTCTFDSTATQQALAGSGIAVPPLEDYAPVLWTYWKEHMRDER